MNNQEIVHFFRLHKEDTDSICVEIGILSDTIFRLEEHLRSIGSDDFSFFAYRLDLIQTLISRKKLLDLLKGTNTPLHQKVSKKIKQWYTLAYSPPFQAVSY